MNGRWRINGKTLESKIYFFTVLPSAFSRFNGSRAKTLFSLPLIESTSIFSMTLLAPIWMSLIIPPIGEAHFISGLFLSKNNGVPAETSSPF